MRKLISIFRAKIWIILKISCFAKTKRHKKTRLVFSADTRSRTVALKLEVLYDDICHCNYKLRFNYFEDEIYDFPNWLSTIFVILQSIFKPLDLSFLLYLVCHIFSELIYVVICNGNLHFIYNYILILYLGLGDGNGID